MKPDKKDNLPSESELLEKQALIYARELCSLVRSERVATEMLKQSEMQLAKFASDFSGVSKANKRKQKALDIADFQLKHYISSIEEKNIALTSAYQGTISCLALAADFKDQHTGEHIVRMSRYTAFLALRCGYSISEAEDILNASPMHDIGKIGIPDAILNKPDHLNPDERKVIEKHTIYGEEILRGAGSKAVELARTIALTHHERWDGKGYPYGLSKTDIPKVGRVAALADVFDALTMKRPYKKAMSFKSAITIIKKERGCLFDPEIVDVFLENITSFEYIKQEVEGQESKFDKIEILDHNKTGFVEWLAGMA